MLNGKMTYDARYFVIWIASIGALGGLLFGFDTGVISGALLFINQVFNLKTWVLQAHKHKSWRPSAWAL